MEERPRTLPERSLGDLLNETFAIYGRHLWQFIGLVAVVQVPISLLALSIGESITRLALVGVTSLIGTSVYYAAGVFAVGQHYVAGDVNIGSCYQRVWWRVLSVVGVGLLIGISLMLAAATAIVIIPAILMLAYLAYWSITFQAVIFEGHRPVSALRRSVNLVRGSWWRVIGIILVYWLVALGLGVLLFLPFLLVMSLSVSGDELTALGMAFQFVGGLVVSVGVWPVLSTAFTLMYYDLRVRKEGYDLATLSSEMGFASVQAGPVVRSN